MKDISRSPARKNDGFHRYLKPGALAQIRNSRINTRSSTSLLSLSLSPPIDPPSQQANNLTVEQVPHLLRKIYGPYSYQRKKLGAARSSMMMMVNLNNNPMIIESSSGGNSSDVIAH
ncbi:unnamed protein product [Eruca vesicaria subsp. sativa]|uniref:Uncharacterized protein n=1 Tax=Eruca vesicaria subsp. sativa TaxID=29727 RepID=A0ABC8L1A5_ERUVS|nr:unnamed protein product [Eruca vesicaria subsp. sativa]